MVMRPIADRPLYSLVYGTRSPSGLEVFRTCQTKALSKQDEARGITKLRAAADSSGQAEMFGSLSDMAPDPSAEILAAEERMAEAFLLNLLRPDGVLWSEVWPQVLERHVVTRSKVNEIANRLRKTGRISIAPWERRQRKPDETNSIRLT